jgi:hypothetical protein
VLSGASMAGPWLDWSCLAVSLVGAVFFCFMLFASGSSFVHAPFSCPYWYITQHHAPSLPYYALIQLVCQDLSEYSLSWGRLCGRDVHGYL